MNVRTVKRFSKRTISTLLSILMVISLFTVCMVGTTVSVNAGGISDNTIIYFDNSETQWNRVSFYYGGNTGNAYYKSYTMTKINGTDLYYVEVGAFNPVTEYFFSDSSNNIVNNNTGTVAVSTIYSGSGQSSAHKTKLMELTGDECDIKTRTLFKPAIGGDNSISVLIVPDSFNYTTTSGTSFTFDATNFGVSGVNTLYLVYGGDDINPYRSVATLIRSGSTNNFVGTINYDWTNMFGYYITTTDTTDSGAMTAAYVNDTGTKTPIINKSINSTANSIIYNSDNTISNVYSDSYGWVDATLYNYRTNSQIAAATSINGTLTEEQNYLVDSTNGESTHTKDLSVYKTYNTAVEKWYKTITHPDTSNDLSTPLYQGNFHDIPNTNPNQNWYQSLYHFMLVANGANRSDGDAVALNLVDTELNENGTITQKGIEIPQFSDAFMAEDGNEKIQGKYDGLKFQVKKTVTNAGASNEKVVYSYNSANDGNRYLNLAEKKIVPGVAVRGADFDGDNNGGRSGDIDGRWRNVGYYPLNEREPGYSGNVINCMGTKIEIQFFMTADGKFNGNDLTFNFTGDDDLWVFIDGHLVLDMGGSHNKASGSINLNKTDGNITSSVTTGTYDPTWRSTYGSSQQTSTNWGVTGGTYTKTFTSSDAVYQSLEDTTDPHTMTIFYMERGLYDSNFSFSYMLPSIEDMNTLKLIHRINSGYVNEGLRLETMAVANNDVFDVLLDTQNMNAGGSNPVSTPIKNGTSFTRKSPNYKYLGDGTTGTKTDKLQIGNNKTAQTDENDASSHKGYQPVKAYYLWEDDSKQLGLRGLDTDFYPKVDSATNKGVGKPVSGYVSMLYDQTATFYNQFPSTLQGTGWTPLVRFGQYENLSEFVATNDEDTGIINKQTSHLGRKHDHFYDGYVVGEGGSYKDGQDAYGHPNLIEGSKTYAAGNEYYVTGKNISLTYHHTIKTGLFTVEKILAEGEILDNTEYTFRIEYKNLFGNGDDNWKLATNLKGTRYSINRTYSEDDTRYLTKIDEPSTTDVGTVGLKADQKITFDGIPVDTKIRITEIATQNLTTLKYATVSQIEFSGTSARHTETPSFDEIPKQNVTVQTKPNEDNSLLTDYYTEIKPYENKTAEELSAPTLDKVAEGVSWGDVYNYKFYNSYSNTPILYRYIDRDIINGKPTKRQAEGYTYFAREIPGAIDSYLDTNGSLTNDTKDRISDLSPQIINVLDSFKLDKNDTKCKFGTVTVTRATSGGKTTYTIDSSKDLGDDFEWGQTAVSDDEDVDKSVGLEDSLEAFFKGENGTIKFLLAQYDNVARTYDVTVEYIKPDTATTGIKSFNVPFNGTANLGSQLSGITVDYGKDNQGNPQSTTYSLGNELYKIHVAGGRDVYFAYWEREVTYYSGNTITTEYVPVSTNFNYNYRVTDNVHLRAVYVDQEMFDGKYRRYVEGKSLSKEPEYVHFDTTTGKTPFMAYDTEKNKKRVRYWIQPAGGSETDRKYSKIEGGPYTIAYADRETAWTDWADDEDTFKIDGYCVPNSDGGRGFASSATDRLYNSYSKEEATTTDGVTTYSRADYTRVDVMFGSVGTYDNDAQIKNVGYILFQNNGSYPDLNTITKENLESIVQYSKDRIQNFKDGDTNNLTDNGQVWYAMNSTNTKNPTNYKVRVGKFTVVGSGFGDGDDGNGCKYVTDSNGKVTAVPLSDTNVYGKLGLGKVNLTNKNRLDIVFDIPNTEQTRQNYYACYTYMIRDDQLYISPVPTTFTPNDVKPDEKNPEGKKAYIINTKSYMYNDTASPQETDTPAGSYGSVTSSFSTAVDGKTLSFHISPNTTNLITESDGKKYIGEFVKLVVGNKTYSPSDLVNGNITHIFKADKENTAGNDVDLTASTLKVKAYFRKVLAGAIFNISPITGIDLNVSQISGTVIGTGAVTEANTEVTVIYGSTVRVTAALKNGYNWVKAVDQLTDYTQDPNNASVRYKEYTLPANSSLNAIGEYSNLGAENSDTEVAEITYTLTVEASANGYVTVKKPDGDEVQVTSSTALDDRTFTVRDTDTNKTFTLNATPTDTSAYRFKNWTGTATTTTNPLSVTVNADTNYKANFESTAKKVYFAFVHQNANDPYPRDGNIGNSCVINGKTYTISYKDNETFNYGGTDYTGSSWKWSGTYQAYFSGSTITNAVVNMTFEGLYKIDGSWNPVYSAELPAGYSTSGINATKVKFYPTEGVTSYDSDDITVGENVVYVAKGDWSTSSGHFQIENKGNISNFIKADGTN